MTTTLDRKGQPGNAQNPVEQEKQPTESSESQSVPTEGQHNLGGGIFDPARWKTPADSRLDPKAKIRPATFSKIEVRKPPPDHYVHVHPDPAFNAIFPLYADSESKRYDPYLIAPELSLSSRLVKLLRKRFQSGSVFITTNFRKAFRIACAKVGLGRKTGSKEWQYEGLLPYDLRRSAIRNLKRAGVQETVAMKISGHKTRAVFDRYNITDVDDVKQAMKRVTQYNASSMQVGRKRSKQK
jgi:hypothetical protein